MYIAVLIAIYITQVVAIELYVSVSIYVALLCRYLSVDNLLCVRSMFLEPFICSISTKDCHMMYMQTINTIVLKCVLFLWKYDPQLSNSFRGFSIFYRLCTFFFHKYSLECSHANWIRQYVTQKYIISPLEQLTIAFLSILYL